MKFYLFFVYVGLLFTFGCSPKIKKKIQSQSSDIFVKPIVYSSIKGFSVSQIYEMGFNYIDIASVENANTIPDERKYILWTGIAYSDRQSPWVKEKSPYNINITKYKSKWDTRLNFYKRKYLSGGRNSKIGIIVLDIEAKKKVSSLIPKKEWKQVEKSRFRNEVKSYKVDMSSLYNTPLQHAKQYHNNYSKWSSYGDTPIDRNWWGISKKSWEEWISDPSVVNYITHQPKRRSVVETDFAKSLDFYSASAYYFYSYKHASIQNAGDYLAYMLFSLEVNQAWTDKPVYIYQTFRFQGKKERNTLIDVDMAKNSIVFAFMSGAGGLILHEDYKKKSSKEYLDLLNAYKEGIGLLNKYSSYFEENASIKYFKPENPRDLMVENKTVIRGIEKNNKLLVAICNPYANNIKNQTISFKYKGKSFNATLNNRELFFKEYDLSK